MDELRDMLLGRGAAVVGYADLSEVPAEARDGMRYGISVGVALDPAIIAGIREGPTEAYVDLYSRVNAFLNELAAATVAFLQERGHRAGRTLSSDPNVDRAALRTPLPHKTVATRAGLGWIGKCALLITEQFGSAVRLVSALTDAELPVGRPVNESRCGTCSECVDVCPGNAPVGRNWQLGDEREDIFDAHACRAAARKVADAAGVQRAICGMCIAACPWTQAYLKRSRAGR